MALNSKQQTLSRLSIESRQSNTTTFLWTSFKTPVSSCCSPCLFFKLHFHHTLSFFKNTRPHVYIHVRQMLHCTPLEFFLFKVPLEKFLLYINITKKKKKHFSSMTQRLMTLNFIINLCRDLNAQKYTSFHILQSRLDENPRAWNIENNIIIF